MLQGHAGIGERARKLRKSMSLPEVMLWKILKQKPCGLKFRRQHPAGPYVVDFYCHEARTIIEIDGISHDMGERPYLDEARDAHFAERGLKVLRIPARDVLGNVQSVAESIVAQCANATVDTPPSAFQAATSPAGGGFDRTLG